MCCRGFWKRIVSFVLTLTLGLLVVTILRKESPEIKNQKAIEPFNKCADKEEVIFLDNKLPQKTEAVTFSVNELPYIEMAGIYPVFIDSIPLPNYTDDAKEKNIQGKVILRVTLLADGKIGSIFVIQSLPFGLTENTIASAKQIKFKPAISHGTLQNETKTIEYNFTIY